MKNSKIFSIKYKLVLIFAFMILVLVLALGFFSVNIAKDAVVEKVETHLKSEAFNTARVIKGRMNTFLEQIKGIGLSPILRNENLSFQEKITMLYDKYNKPYFVYMTLDVKW